MNILSGPPSAPTNFTITWGPPADTKFSLLSYIISLTSGSGVAIKNITLVETHFIIAILDPCQLYYASVTAQYTSPTNCSGTNATTTLVGGNSFICIGALYLTL